MDKKELMTLKNKLIDMKLTTYKQKDSMIHLLIASILFFIPLGGFADEKQREIENEAINLVIKKIWKRLRK